MSKHTPGPWYKDAIGRIWRRHPSELYENGGGVAGDCPVATVWQGWYGEDLVGFPVEANARLIAAAPELLEACKGLLGIAERHGWLHVAVDAAKAAIAKAEGGSDEDL